MITDIISSQTAVGSADFVVNNAVLEVPVTSPDGTAGNSLAFRNNGGAQFFAVADNFIIKKIWTNIPFGFGQGTSQHSITILLRQDGILYRPDAFISVNNAITIPNRCDPLDFPPAGVMVNPKASGVLPGGSKFDVVLAALALNVSMVNVPAVLNGQDIHVQYHLEVLHTAQLSTVP